MAETANFGLYITDDNTEKFYDWRTKMNGINDSNMTKIDAALTGKADASTSVSATLDHTQWQGDTAPYTQVLSVPEMTSQSNGSISVSQSISAEQSEAAHKAVLSVASQETGTLTIKAAGDLPVVDIPVTIILLG